MKQEAAIAALRAALERLTEDIERESDPESALVLARATLKTVPRPAPIEPLAKETREALEASAKDEPRVDSLTDQIVVAKTDGTGEWLVGDPAFPLEVDLRLYRHVRTEDYNGDVLAESRRYRLVR